MLHSGIPVNKIVNIQFDAVLLHEMIFMIYDQQCSAMYNDRGPVDTLWYTMFIKPDDFSSNAIRYVLIAIDFEVR